MASRFTDTEIWNEDWFCEMPGEYQLFVKYVFDTCDNAGIWKPKKFDFEMKTKFKVSLDLLFKKMNGGGPQRVLLLDNGRWFITGFLLYQWFNKKKSFDLVLTNRLHKSLYCILIENNVPLQKVRGLKEVLKTSMVMDMDSNEVDKGVKGEKTLPIQPPFEPFVFSQHTLLPGPTQEAAEQNQFALTGNRNTQFVRTQWLIFLYERLNESELKQRQYKSISDLTTYFLNWLRTKKPTDGTDQKRTGKGGKSAGANQLLESLRADLNTGGEPGFGC